MEVERCDAICDHTKPYTLLHSLLSLSTGIVDLDSDQSIRDLSTSPNTNPLTYYGQVVEVRKAAEGWSEYTRTGVRPAPDDMAQQPVRTLCIQKTMQFSPSICNLGTSMKILSPYIYCHLKKIHISFHI